MTALFPVCVGLPRSDAFTITTLIHAFDWKNTFHLTTDLRTGTTFSGGWSSGPWDDRYFFNNDKTKTQPYTVTENGLRYVVNEKGDKQLVLFAPDGLLFIKGWNLRATMDAKGIHFANQDTYYRETPIPHAKPLWTITQSGLMKSLATEKDVPKPYTEFQVGDYTLEFHTLEDLPTHIQLVEGGFVTRVHWKTKDNIKGHMRILVGLNVVKGQPTIHAVHAFNVTSSNDAFQLHINLFGAPHEIRENLFRELKNREPLLKQFLEAKFETLKAEIPLGKFFLAKVKAQDLDFRFRQDRIEIYKH